MAAQFPKSLRKVPVQGVFCLAVTGFFLLFALLYEPAYMMELLSTGQGFFPMQDMTAFNLAIICAVIFVSMVILRTAFVLARKVLTTSIGRYSLWCLFEVLVTAAFIALYLSLMKTAVPDSRHSYFLVLGSCVRMYFGVAFYPYVLFTLYMVSQEQAVSEPLSDSTRIRIYDNRHLLRFAAVASSIVYIEAEENYILVHYLENGMPKKTQIRNTMKSMEKICENGTFVRVHRSYIVNPKHVKLLRKDPGGFYFAELDVEAPEIPVSKRYQKSLDAIL